MSAKLEPASSKNNEILEKNVLQKYISLCSLWAWVVINFLQFNFLQSAKFKNVTEICTIIGPWNWSCHVKFERYDDKMAYPLKEI